MKLFADPALPGLATALDVDAVLEMLRRALPECSEQVELLGGDIVDVRYNRPATHCVVQYRLELKERATQRLTAQTLSARVLREGESPPALLPAQRDRYTALLDNALRTPTLYFPGMQMVVYAFPVDVTLPWLFDALAPPVMTRELNRIWPRQRNSITQVTPHLLKYRPQLRALFRYEVLQADEETTVPQLRRCIGKMHMSNKTAKFFADAWALRQAAAGRVGLALPTGYISSLHLTLQEQVQGQSLGAMVTLPSFVPLVRRTANMLAVMHGLSFPLLQCRTPQDEARLVRDFATVLSKIRPDLTQRIEGLSSRLAVELETSTRPCGPVHGDFHDFNVLVDGEQLTFIDFDGLAYGDPLVDVGRFLASLRKRAVFTFGNPSQLVEAEAGFWNEYLSLTSAEERRAQLFAAAFLLKSAAFPFESRRPQWREESATFLEEAERVFRATTRSTTTAGRTREREPTRSFSDRMEWARDSSYMQALLDPYVHKAYEAEVTACRVVSEQETETVSQVRYGLSGWRQDAPWTIFLDGFVWRDRTHRALVPHLAALRSALDKSPEAPRLPRPIAYLPPLSMTVTEVPSGLRFSSLLGTPKAWEAATRVARALAAIHRVQLVLDNPFSLDDELSVLRQRIERLETGCPHLYTAALELFAQVQTQSRSISPRLAPILRRIGPGEILCQGQHIAVKRITDITLSHPLIAVGDFLARLTLISLNHGNSQEITAVAERFRQASIAAEAVSREAVAICEAQMLMRLACTRAERDSQQLVVERLFSCAAARLAAV
jgi:aminoglycoside phosphotransferase (APT) family kinase protein